MQRIHLGLAGWYYPEWVGPFYAPGTLPGKFLETYAKAFNFVEVNSAYHDAPPRERVASWAEHTPPHFRFSVKVPETIVLKKRLNDADAAMEKFADSLVPLRAAGKLARVLLAMTPSFRYAEHLGNLEAFLDEWAPRDPFAVELRHKGWWREETYDLLRKHNVPLVWSVAQHGRGPAIRTPPVRTADTIYVRVIGDRNLDHEDANPTKPLLSNPKWDRVRRDETQELAYWRDRVKQEGADANDAWFVINNHLQGHAPASARIAADLPSIPQPKFDAARGGQRTLTGF